MNFFKELWIDFFRGLKFWSALLIGVTVIVSLIAVSQMHPKVTGYILLSALGAVIIWATGVFLEPRF